MMISASTTTHGTTIPAFVTALKKKLALSFKPPSSHHITISLWLNGENVMSTLSMHLTFITLQPALILQCFRKSNQVAPTLLQANTLLNFNAPTNKGKNTFFITLTTCLASFRELWTWTSRFHCTRMVLHVLKLTVYILLRFDCLKWNVPYLPRLNSIFYFSTHICNWSYRILWQLHHRP